MLTRIKSFAGVSLAAAFALVMAGGCSAAPGSSQSGEPAGKKAGAITESMCPALAPEYSSWGSLDVTSPVSYGGNLLCTHAYRIDWNAGYPYVTTNVVASFDQNTCPYVRYQQVIWAHNADGTWSMVSDSGERNCFWQPPTQNGGGGCVCTGIISQPLNYCIVWLYCSLPEYKIMAGAWNSGDQAGETYAVHVQATN